MHVKDKSSVYAFERTTTRPKGRPPKPRIPPEDLIRMRGAMAEGGVSARALAHELGMTRQRVSAVLGGRRGVESKEISIICKAIAMLVSRRSGISFPQRSVRRPLSPLEGATARVLIGAKRLSLRTVAKEVSVSPSTLSRGLYGKASLPFQELADLLVPPTSYLPYGVPFGTDEHVPTTSTMDLSEYVGLDKLVLTARRFGRSDLDKLRPGEEMLWRTCMSPALGTPIEIRIRRWIRDGGGGFSTEGRQNNYARNIEVYAGGYGRIATLSMEPLYGSSSDLRLVLEGSAFTLGLAEHVWAYLYSPLRAAGASSLIQEVHVAFDFDVAYEDVLAFQQAKGLGVGRLRRVQSHGTITGIPNYTLFGGSGSPYKFCIYDKRSQLKEPKRGKGRAVERIETRGWAHVVRCEIRIRPTHVAPKCLDAASVAQMLPEAAGLFALIELNAVEHGKLEHASFNAAQRLGLRGDTPTALRAQQMDKLDCPAGERLILDLISARRTPVDAQTLAGEWHESVRSALVDAARRYPVVSLREVAERWREALGFQLAMYASWQKPDPTTYL